MWSGQMRHIGRRTLGRAIGGRRGHRRKVKAPPLARDAICVTLSCVRRRKLTLTKGERARAPGDRGTDWCRPNYYKRIQ